MYRWVRGSHKLSLRSRGFMEAPWAGGVVLLACVVIAMLLANLPMTKEYYHNFLETDLSLVVHSPNGLIDWAFPQGMTVEKFINDCLMVIFFFTVGLEIKREVVNGQLSSMRKAILPVVAAAGGMLCPALIFAIFNHGTFAANGWGIPTATDIAFAVGILSMLGDRVPVSLKIFLTALAIADDLGAILVIAFFYGGELQLGLLLIALLVMAGVYVIYRLGEKRMIFYMLPAVVVWGLFYYSGVHATLSGVAMALLIPMEPRYSKEYFIHKMRWLKDHLLAVEASDEEFPHEEHRFYLRQMTRLGARSAGMSWPTPGWRSRRSNTSTSSISRPRSARWAWVSSSDFWWANPWASSPPAGWPSRARWLSCPRGHRGACCWPWPAWAVSGSRCRCSSIRWPTPIPD